MRTRSDFATAAEHIAYTQGIIDAGRERVPMTEYERASLRLKALAFVASPHAVSYDDYEYLVGQALDFAMKPEKDA